MLWQLRHASWLLSGMLPFKGTARKVKRRFVPLSVDLDPVAFRQCLEIETMIRESGIALEGARILELGPGWRPVLPLILSAGGAASVLMVDNERFMDSQLLGGTARELVGRDKELASALGQDPGKIREALAAPAGASFEELLAHWRLEYHAPCDTRGLESGGGGLDTVVSRAVLEYIPPKVLRGIFESCRRLLRPGGTMCHLIDNSDQWCHRDAHIPKLNFLKFSDRTANALGWAHPQSYQNRMRHGEYVTMIREAGFEITEERSHVDEIALAQLRDMKLDRKYADVPHEELARLTSWISARNPG